MDEALRMLIEFLEAASPAVWAAAQQQVLAEFNMLWVWMGVIGLLFLLSLVGTIVLAARSRRYHGDDGFTAGFLGVVAVLLLLVLIGLATRQYGIHSNPSWYAILKLRELLPK